ncbi:MAG: rhamnogalacturonan acetylesterase [Verrucomicrobiae bacterium]|nr:rhamnogalacturonan acetylesterase [Verrucomicrobiae bacterium]
MICARAQSDPATAPANQLAPHVAPDSSDTNRTVPVLFLIGDSTVHNDDPEFKGWGDVIAAFFDTNKILVRNHARPGRSSRTFQTQGWWSNLLTAARPGDFVIIQFGHNDSSPLDDTNRARGTLPGVGEESKEVYNPLMKKPEVVRTYGWYIRKYIADARAKGMTPIVCSPVPRVPKQPIGSDISETNSYADWARQVAQQENAPFIDLHRLVLQQYAGLTPEQIKAKYFTPRDNTHTSAAGAQLNAACVVKALQQLEECGLRHFLRANLDIADAP